MSHDSHSRASLRGAQAGPVPGISTVGGIVLLAWAIETSLLIMWMLWARFKPRPHRRVPVEKLKHYLALYGSAWHSYLHLNNALYHYELDGVGVLTYAWVYGLIGATTVCVSDPLCSVDDAEKLIHAFEGDIPGHHIYLTMSESYASVLHESFGYCKTQWGKDYYCKLNKWNPPPKHGRHAFAAGTRRGLVLKEQAWADVDQNRVREISHSWLLKKRLHNELRALTWPVHYGDEWGIRKFYCYDADGNMVAFTWWTPIFSNGRTVGYTVMILRRDSRSKDRRVQGLVQNFMFYACIEKFRSEGIDYIGLGPAYGHQIEARDGDSPTARKFNQFIYYTLDTWYGLRSLAAHKDHMHANRPCFIYQCHKGWYGLLASLCVLSMGTEAVPYLSTFFFGYRVFSHNPDAVLPSNELASVKLAVGTAGEAPIDGSVRVTQQRGYSEPSSAFKEEPCS